MAIKFEQVSNECWGRDSVPFYQKRDRTISSKEVECIDSNLIQRYNIEGPNFSHALFTECYIELNKKINNYHLVSKVEDYDPGRLKYLWFSLDWECSICTVAKMRGLAYLRMVKRKKGKPDATEKTTLKCYKVYSNCFQQFYQGSNDSVSKYWSSWRYKVSPGNDLVNSRNTLQIVASCVIKNHADTPFFSTLGPKKKLIRTSAEASTRTN